MKTLNLFVVALCIAALTAFGCNQTTAPLMATGEWVEITDTMSMPDISGLTNDYSLWREFTGLRVKDSSEYYALAKLVDTTNPFYKPIRLPQPPNLSQYSMIGMHTETMRGNYFVLRRKLEVNDAAKLYRYTITIFWNDTLPFIPYRVQSQN